MRDWPLHPTPRYRRAVFLDRDGTINVDTHFPHKVETLRLVPKAIDGLRVLAALPLHIIVVSNQAGIALGMYTVEQMSEFNTALRLRIERGGARIDAFYFCPHREPKHMAYGATACACAKPSPGMLLEAAADYAIELSRSFVIGDRSSDTLAGRSARCTTVLLETGKAAKELAAEMARPDYRAKNLYEASLLIRELVTLTPLPQEVLK